MTGENHVTGGGGTGEQTGCCAYTGEEVVWLGEGSQERQRTGEESHTGKYGATFEMVNWALMVANWCGRSSRRAD